MAKFLFIFVMLVSLQACKSKSVESSPAKVDPSFSDHPICVARSVENCLSKIIINFYDNNQYIAYYSSDVGNMNHVQHRGYYERFDDEHFVIFSPFFGNIFFHADDQGIFMPDNYTIEKGLSSGLRLRYEIREVIAD